MKGSLGRAVEARCAPNKLGFWVELPAATVAPAADLFRSSGWFAELGAVVVERVRAVKLLPNLVLPAGDELDEADDDDAAIGDSAGALAPFPETDWPEVACELGALALFDVSVGD